MSGFRVYDSKEKKYFQDFISIIITNDLLGTEETSKGINYNGDYVSQFLNIDLSVLGSSIPILQSVAISSTGQYQTVVDSNGVIGIVNSSDYGITWTQNQTAPTGANWNGVSMSSTGQYQTVVDKSAIHGIYTSSDFGVTWVQNQTPGTQNVRWNGVSLSSSGQYQTAADAIIAGKVWTSTDFGNTWVIVYNNQGSNWQAVAVSSTGQYQTVVDAPPLPSGPSIIISSNYGASLSWTNPVFSGIQPNNPQWTGVSMSSSGQYQTIVDSANNDIWISINYGQVWNKVFNSLNKINWKGVSMSSSGQYQTAVATTHGAVFTSFDYGNTWWQDLGNQNSLIPYQSGSASVSSTGQYQTICKGTSVQVYKRW